MLRRVTVLAGALAATAAALATAGAAAPGPPQPDQAGVLDLPAGYSYTTLATSCVSQETSLESGTTFAMPEDPDAKVLFPAGNGDLWLVWQAELTQPRAGDFQGDAGKCHVDEQTAGDNDSNGWGSVSRLTLAPDGVTVKDRVIITTGLHDLCAGAMTPWGTYLANEEFPFIVDPVGPDGEQGSGWVWEIDPATGAQTKLTAMGRFSHEQEAFVGGNWYLTDDRGDARFIYKFVPNDRGSLTAGGRLYGLAFSKRTGIGTWVGPLNYKNPDADMRARGYDPNQWGFMKAEGMVGNGSPTGIGGDSVYFSESGVGADPGRVWSLRDLGFLALGRVAVEGDWGQIGRPDNLRFSAAGDLYVMEDHSASDFNRGPTGHVNQIWVLPAARTGGVGRPILFGSTPDEPTGPWFSTDGKLLYLSIQAEPPRQSHIVAIHAATSFSQPYLHQ